VELDHIGASYSFAWKEMLAELVPNSIPSLRHSTVSTRPGVPVTSYKALSRHLSPGHPGHPQGAMIGRVVALAALRSLPFKLAGALPKLMKPLEDIWNWVVGLTRVVESEPDVLQAADHIVISIAVRRTAFASSPGCRCPWKR
jgi:hypothetical protein